MSNDAYEAHCRAAHYPKDPRCVVCQLADGPVRFHKTIEEDRPGVLHVDIAGPLPKGFNGARYMVVAALAY
eukprot:6227577-Amphidinium_carterae.1